MREGCGSLNKLSENALKVLNKRYFLKNKDGKVIEDWQGLCHRVSNHIASCEKEPDKWAKEFYKIIYELDFLPNSPCLGNAGRELGNLSACYVIPVEDSIDGIFDAIKLAANIHKSGGGTGMSFSKLRPSGSIVKSSQGVASGPVSFMKVFNGATEAIKQGGTRRGANMGILRIDHQDIEEFITCKSDLVSITNFNISVAITDEFMEALSKNKDYNLYDPRSGGKVGNKSAKKIFDLIAENAWKSGDPGLFFIDRVNRLHPGKLYECIEASNPCGEQPLGAYDVCTLGSINLASLVSEDGIDYERLTKIIQVAIRFLDNVVTVNKYPDEKIREKALSNRRIGLGIMGLADALIKLKIRYGSQKSINYIDALMKIFKDLAITTSIDLAKEKGLFPRHSESTLKELQRNLCILTIAPTGTISLIANCSSGIEPIFALEFESHRLDTVLKERNPLLDEFLKNNPKYSYPDNMPDYWIDSFGVSIEEHIKMQAICQKYIDSSVSKTINMPNSATVEDIKKAYLMAWELGCKGITVFRDGCKGEQVLVRTNSKKEPDRKSKERPEDLEGVTKKITTPFGNLYTTVNFHLGQPRELFIQIGKSGSDITAFCEAIGRLVSLCFAESIDSQKVISQLSGIGGSTVTFSKNGKFRSIPDAIAMQLNKAMDVYQEQTINTCGKPSSLKSNRVLADICIDCHSGPVIQEARCRTCQNCGLSSC